MTTLRVQSFASLRDEMIAVARGERKAPSHAAEPSVHSADLIARLLTPDNRALMFAIRERNPESVAHLAEMTNREPSNLTRTLDKLAAVGLITFTGSGRRKIPHAAAGKIMIEIDPFSLSDTVRVMKLPRILVKRLKAPRLNTLVQSAQKKKLVRARKTVTGVARSTSVAK